MTLALCSFDEVNQSDSEGREVGSGISGGFIKGRCWDWNNSPLWPLYSSATLKPTPPKNLVSYTTIHFHSKNGKGFVTNIELTKPLNISAFNNTLERNRP